MTELQGCFPDGRVIHEREKPRRIGHDGPIEKRLVMFEQIGEVDVAIEIRPLMPELHHHSIELNVLRLGDIG
jgi:hypothetical protein